MEMQKSLNEFSIVPLAGMLYLQAGYRAITVIGD